MKMTIHVLQRQISMGSMKVKDWCYDCLMLVENYVRNFCFCQAEYLLKVALVMLPADLSKKGELRATVHLYLGNFYLEKMSTLIERQLKGEVSQVPAFT